MFRLSYLNLSGKFSKHIYRAGAHKVIDDSAITLYPVGDQEFSLLQIEDDDGFQARTFKTINLYLGWTNQGGSSE